MVSEWPKDKCNFIHKKIKSSPGMGEAGTEGDGRKGGSGLTGLED
jgi:hypothetical protein